MTEITAPSPIRQAVEQLRSINSSQHVSVMQRERDEMEIKRTDISIAISNLNSEIDSFRKLRDELDQAIATKTRLRNEHVSAFESVVRTISNLDIQGKRMEAGV